MSKDMFKVVATGRLTRDAEVKKVGDTNLLTFTLASNSSWKKDAGACFMQFNWWGDRGTKILQWLKKGVRIAVEGTMNQEEWEKDGKKMTAHRVDVSDVILIDTRVIDGGDKTEDSAQKTAPTGAAAQSDFVDDIPF